MNAFAFKVIDAINRDGMDNGSWGLVKDVDNTVRFLKTNSGKKGEGMPVVRNPQFYFRDG